MTPDARDDDRADTGAVRRMQVIGYLRVSTNGQATNGHGLDAQRAAIQAEADRRGWAVTWLEDPGVSAKSMDRPAVQYALELLREGAAEALVVSKLDRLSRSLSDFAGVMETARRERWALVALDMNVDMTTETGEAMAGMMAVFAQWERRVISRRTREGLAAAKAKGIQLGARVAVPDDVAERITGLRADGQTLTAIADELNAEHVPTARGGSRWWPSTVRAVLARTATD